MKKIYFFTASIFLFPLHAENEILKAIQNLDYQQVIVCLKNYPPLSPSQQSKLLDDVNNIIIKEKQDKPWYKKYSAFGYLAFGIPVFYLSFKFLNEAYKHNMDNDMNIKHLLYRFYKGFPARVALLAYPVDGGVILFHIPLIALSGALAITSIDFILKGISILLSSKNDRYLKALAIKSLIQDNLATN